MHKLGFVILVFMLLATQCIARSTNERDVVEVPFSILKGLVIVDAKIKGNVPVKVALATGIEHSITDMASVSPSRPEPPKRRTRPCFPRPRSLYRPLRR